MRNASKLGHRSRPAGRDEGADPSATARVIKTLSSTTPKLAIVLGSGFHGVVQHMQVERRVSYQALPGFPRPGVSGHAGELLIGRMGGNPVIVLSGRAHYYEGHDMSVVTFAVRTLVAYGISDLVLTNAAGGINRKFRPGDFMLLSDHINLMGTNPLRGPTLAGLPRFVDMTHVYDPALSASLKTAARKTKLKLHSGVYLAVSGPSYETPAEIRAFATLGADAVGMSTVPEAIVARQCGLRVAGLSCITNLAAGRSSEPLSHAEVLETAEKVKTLAGQMLKTFAELHAKDQ
jgi:purine-nucleoside phosphorylase